MSCWAELCRNWTGQGCICAVLDIPADGPEDGEQCIHCLRYTYDPHAGRCLRCGYSLNPEDGDG